MKDFFISYNKSDRQMALWIAQQLKSHGYSAIVQAEDMPPGSNFIREMDKACKEARQIILVLSPDYLLSAFTQPEWHAFFRRDPTGDKRLMIPVRVRECTPEGLLAQVVYIDLVGKAEGAAKEALFAGIELSCAQSQSPARFPIEELLERYQEHLTEKVSRVRLFGEKQSRAIENVFVELTITEGYERPASNVRWRGLMDAELRRQRDIFEWRDGGALAAGSETQGGKSKRRLRPDELSGEHLHAVIVGAPGCGKTTLLRYLTGRTEKRWPVFLELKTVSPEAFAAASGRLDELLFNRAVAGMIHLSATDQETLHDHFCESLAAGEAALFLDGLDEVSGAEFFPRLCQSVNEFIRSEYGKSDLIISTRPYALQTRFEGMKELEIEPLNQLQTDQFLSYYYGEQLKKLLMPHLRRRELRELARVPFLLSVIAYLYREQGELVGERLELYRQIVWQLVNQLDREKPVERFQIYDPTGAVKRNALKELAYERLFVDHVEKDAERLVFTTNDILSKAQNSCPPHIRADLLTADVIATPLLREVGADAYAFAHLTIQEYLAAEALAEQIECKKIFFRSYFDLSLADMEVLPMTLGLVRQPDDFYSAMEELSESLTLSNFRLRARGLAYARVSQENLATLTDHLVAAIIGNSVEEISYFGAIIHSFSVANNLALKFILDRVASLLTHNDAMVRARAALTLGNIGGEQVVDKLGNALYDENDSEVLVDITQALGRIGGEQSVACLSWILDEWESTFLRVGATLALGHAGGEQATAALLKAMNDRDGSVRWSAIEALGYVGGNRAETALLEALKDTDWAIRDGAAKALGQLGGELAISALIAALSDENNGVRAVAAEALGRIGAKQAVAAVSTLLLDIDSSLRCHAAIALGRIGGNDAVSALIPALDDADDSVRVCAAAAMGKAGGERAVTVLINALEEGPQFAKETAIPALGRIGGERAVIGLLGVLKDANEYLRRDAVETLGLIGGRPALVGLLDALMDKNSMVHWAAAEALARLDYQLLRQGMLSALSHNNSFVRQKAVEVIGYYTNSDQVLNVLRRLAEYDPVPEVKKGAQEAVRKFEHKLIYLDIVEFEDRDPV